MYLPIWICLLLSLSISVHGNNHYLDNNFDDLNDQNLDQNYEPKQSEQSEQSYLKKLEDKITLENELDKLEQLLSDNKLNSVDEQPNNYEQEPPKDDDIDEYLKYQSTDLMPAFDFKELNNQQQSSSDDQLQVPNQIDHYLTTMSTDSKNRLMNGPRLRRTWKKDPVLSKKIVPYIYPILVNPWSESPEDERSDLNKWNSMKQSSQDENSDQSYRVQYTPIPNDKEQEKKIKKSNTPDFEEDLNKEIDLDELEKYLMAKKRASDNLTKHDDSSISSNSSKSSKESNDSKESKDNSKESAFESKPLNNILTELRKTIITNENGKAIKKVETYKKSVELSEPNDQSDFLSTFNQPIDANLERAEHHVDQSNPMLRQQRDAIGSGTHFRISKYVGFSDIYFIGVVVVCSMVSIMSVIGAGYCFYRFQQHNKATQDVEYPAYGIIGPAFKSSQDDDASPKVKKNPLTQESLVNKATSINHQSILSQDAANTGSDRKLAQSAQMYHYHHQKQQMILTEKNKNMRNTSTSDVESDEENEENEEGDYTVYECPGLATNLGEIEITNPNFQHENVEEGESKATPETK